MRAHLLMRVRFGVMVQVKVSVGLGLGFGLGLGLDTKRLQSSITQHRSVLSQCRVESRAQGRVLAFEGQPFL